MAGNSRVKEVDNIMKVNSKPGPLLAPVPSVMVSCGSMEEPNIITIAWTGIINSDPPMTYISVQPKRYSHDIIEKSGEFVINLVPSKLAKAMDFCGVRSGRDVDKFSSQGLTAEKADTVSAPLIAESPVNIECKVKDIVRMPTHDMFMAEVVGVSVDDRYLDQRGRLALEKADLIAYSHGEYYTLGRKLGTFGFSVRKKASAAQQKASAARSKANRRRK